MTPFLEKIRAWFRPHFNIRASDGAGVCKFLPRVAMHWFLVMLFATVLTVLASASVIFVIGDNNMPKKAKGEEALVRRVSVLNRKLLEDVLQTYERKKEKIEILKHQPLKTVDPSL